MTRFYSKATGSTYLAGFNIEIPPDAVEITEQCYLDVIASPEPGKIRSHDAAGLPILIEPPPLSAERLGEVERAWRAAALVVPCALRDRHRDEVELGIATTLTAEQFVALLGYIQQLRDWPQSGQFPGVEYRPSPPAWLAAE